MANTNEFRICPDTGLYFDKSAEQLMKINAVVAVVFLLAGGAMGLLVGLLAKLLPTWQNEARLLVAVGLLGGFTTFSAFSLDAIVLIERGQVGQALVYISLSVVLSILALVAGLLFMRGLPL